MASRDIANMHVFLDLKKKFPDLPDETLRSYISLFAEDQEKCLSLLQKESENHYHPSQPFPDFRLPENKVSAIKNDYVRNFAHSSYDGCSDVNLQQLYIPIENENVPKTSGRSNRITSFVHLPKKSLNQNTSSKPESLSAPVITNSERPFIYKQNPISSQPTYQLSSGRSNQFIFQTTKNHIIETPKTHESTAFLSVSGEPEQSRKHAVTLSITPSFPFHQQHINVFNNSIYTTASHSPRLDRHTTSVNFHLQPQTSSQFPLEISAIPTNIGQSCDSKDFCSHVQISVGEQGTTFTAVRLQHPSYLQTENASRLPMTEICTPSSQVLNSSLSSPNRRVHLSPNSGEKQPFKYPISVTFDQNRNVYAAMIQPTAQMSSIQNYLSPHENAVKNQQIAQLDMIFNELEREKANCSLLRSEVNKLEERITKRNAELSYPTAEVIKKLREEVKNLRVEVGCLSMEVDSAFDNAGKFPLCVTDEGAFGSNNAPKQDPQQVSPENANEAKSKMPYEEEDDDKNKWPCNICTYKNHPALEKCEMCELPKNSGSFFGYK